MAVNSNLTSVAKLAVLLHLTLAPDDQYAKLIIAAASNAVRDEARQYGWVTAQDGDTLDEGITVAPSTAQDITLWLASRAYTNPRNLSRKTAGPISESYFENGVYGLELSEDEKARLGRLRDGGVGGGLWVQPIYSGQRANEHLYTPSDMDPAGAPFYIADADQWPYNIP